MRISNSFQEKDKQVAKFRPFEDRTLIFAVVTGATAVVSPNTKYMWKYTIAPAFLEYTAGAYPTTSSRNEGSFDAFSVSELGNTTDTFSYGVDLSGITQFTDSPPSIFPTRIPNGTPVVAMAYRNKTDAQVYYLIINTQAITGQC